MQHCCLVAGSGDRTSVAPLSGGWRTFSRSSLQDGNAALAFSSGKAFFNLCMGAKKRTMKASVVSKKTSLAKAPTIFQLVRKRDSRVVPFDQSHIVNAVAKAMTAGGEGDESRAVKVADAVTAALLKKYPANYVLGIEEIQDAVESALITFDYPKTAKAYILYRQERAKLREERREIPPHVKQLVTESKQYFRSPLSEFIYYKAFSRWIPEEGRRETWIETVDRYVSYMRENLGDMLTDAEYSEVREGILRQEAMPSMRLLWGAGPAARAAHMVAYNCSFIAPSKLEDFGEIMMLSMCGCGVGFSVEEQSVQRLPQIERQSGKVLSTHTIADSKEGWANATVLGLKTWFAGKDIQFDYSGVRPAGARLKTMGGKSSGPAPLRDLMTFARKKILARQGKRLRTIDVHDIVCKIGEIVVAGGVRRSALISLSDLDDTDMRFAKSGQFYMTEPQRSMANNSVGYNEKPTCTQFLDEWTALAKNGTGERGIFNRGGLQKQMPARRWNVFAPDAATSGTNPCVPEDTWVLTSEGARQVKDLIGRSFFAIVNGREQAASGFYLTGEKEVFDVVTDRGFSFRATDNHRVLVSTYRSRKKEVTEWKEVGALRVGDRLMLNRHENVGWGGRGTEAEGWLLGNLIGDGNIEKNGKANLDYWGITRDVMMQRAVNLVHATVGGRSDLVGSVASTGYGRVQSVALGQLAAAYGLSNGHKAVTAQIEEASSPFYAGFLRGLFDADGSVQGTQRKGVSVRLSSSSSELLCGVQRMLARIGIIATTYLNRRPAQARQLPDGRGGSRFYFCQADHELIISGANLQQYADRVGFSDPKKQERLTILLRQYRRVLNREMFSASVRRVVPCGRVPVYDCNVPGVHAFDGNGFYLHNCGEIILKSKEFCNLTEVVARPDDTEETLMRKIRLAAILGTYQSTLTTFPFLSKEWKKNCETERLLGVSITGQWDCPAVRHASVLAALRDEAVRVNKMYAKRFKINQSTCVTCVKPSGELSQLVDSSSGLHPRHAPYYIRRVRIASTDSLFQMLRDQKVPYHPEVGQLKDTATTFVLEFPIKAPEGTKYKDDFTALDQLEYWKMVKENYTEHNPSVTVSVGADEWITVGNWVYEHWDMVGGLSFLPREDHVYSLAPYEAITEERYKEIKASFPDIDFSQILLYDKDDETKGSKTLACVSGVCEVA